MLTGRADSDDRLGALPLPRGTVPAVAGGPRGGRHPRDDVQLGDEVRRGHPQGPVWQRGALGRQHDVRGHLRARAEGARDAGAQHDAREDRGAAGAQVLGVDRRLDSRVAVHLPADVDLEAGVRRERRQHRPPQVHLNARPLASAATASAFL